MDPSRSSADQTFLDGRPISTQGKATHTIEPGPPERSTVGTPLCIPKDHFSDSLIRTLATGRRWHLAQTAEEEREGV
jgi:hypothetical protein